MTEDDCFIDCWSAICWFWESVSKVMAGSQEDAPARRLRGRIVPLPSKSHTASVLDSKAEAGGDPRKKYSTKRAPPVDVSCLAAGDVPVQHVRKRPALVNITNRPNPSSSVLTCAASKSKAIPSCSNSSVSAIKVVGASSSPIGSQIIKDVQALAEPTRFDTETILDPHPRRDSVADSSITSENDENVCTNRDVTSIGIAAATSGVFLIADNQTNVNGLHHKTRCNLDISRELSEQGRSFKGHADEEGWSNKTYLDIDSHKDPRMCSTYASEIYHHLRVNELKRRPAVDFMEVIQQDINASMRGILVDWLVEVAEEYKLVPDTLYLTVSYIDRFLSGNVVTRQRLQLLGVACMLVASKYEEICAPHVEEFCYITDNTYNREEVLEMERSVLNFLRFELTGPTTKSFLRRFIRAAQAEQKSATSEMEFLGNYLAELALLEYGFLRFLPSLIAAAAVFVAKLTLSPTCRPWGSTLRHYSGYKESELKDCAVAILDLQKNTKNCTLPAIREKYRQQKFKCVASLLPVVSIPPEYFDDME